MEVTAADLYLSLYMLARCVTFLGSAQWTGTSLDGKRNKAWTFLLQLFCHTDSFITETGREKDREIKKERGGG
jgi:hypothetical protein